MAKRAYKLAVGDLETDPFKHNRPIKPFCAEFYDGEIKHQIWGDDCVKQFVEFVAGLPDPYIIYFHNGGRFDYFLGFLEYFHDDIKIINRRVVKAFIGKDEYRDSYAIMPEPLKSFGGKFQKLEFDYKKMEKRVREKNKAEILEYLHMDCLTLHEN